MLLTRKNYSDTPIISLDVRFAVKIRANYDSQNVYRVCMFGENTKIGMFCAQSNFSLYFDTLREVGINLNKYGCSFIHTVRPLMV